MSKVLIKTSAKLKPITVLAALLVFAAGNVQPAETGSPVVRAVLFASPTCPHCTYVKEEVLPPLISRYGPRLQIAMVNITTETGHELFLTACMKHGLLSLSVPLLLVGNAALVGSDDIPKKFPDLIKQYLAAGGADWPNLPGLSAMVAANPILSAGMPPDADTGATEPGTTGASTAAVVPKSKDTPSPAVAVTAEKAIPPTQPKPVEMQSALPSAEPKLQASDPGRSVQPVPAAPPMFPVTVGESAGSGAVPSPATVQTEPSGMIDLTAGEKQMGVLDRIKLDIYGNGLAILVLTGMVLILLLSPFIMRRMAIPANQAIKPRCDWLIPILILAGLGIAGYLSNIEVRQVKAVCGPVGDCNAVNQSQYATLFGILPIGVLGFAGFLAILVAWALRRWGSRRISLWAAVGILGMTLFGTLFSVYLTFLEPFVIGATCLWCLSSAVLMTALYVLALKPGRRAWSELSGRTRS